MDFRKTFDRIPDQFDKWRPRYCDELFRDIIEYAIGVICGHLFEILSM